MIDDYDNDVQTLDILTTEAGLAAMEDGPSTPEDKRWAGELVASAQERIAEMRRNLLPASEPIKRIGPLRPGLLALSRDALVAMLDKLTATWGPQVQYAHRSLDELTDNDLRYLIQVLDPAAGAE